MENKLTVYFDGLCRLCSREIEHYQKQVGAEQITFIDITTTAFDAEKEGLDPFLIHQIMHVRRRDGSLATKVDAFIEIWIVLPRYQWAAHVAQTSGIYQLLSAGYWGFAKIRPFLPRRARECDTSPYCAVNK